MKRQLLFVASCLMLSTSVNGQVDTTDNSGKSLEEIMKNESFGVASGLEHKMASSVEVASAKPMVVRKSPAILSVITAAEIETSGARNLLDLLSTIPGFDFGMDVEGIVGIGVRGNWAQEGKVLMLIDGQEINETLFGTIQFGTGFPLDQIRKIEIIRGPGSAIYGGAAEYAVINIVTKNEKDVTGLNVSGAYGRFPNSKSQSSISGRFNQKMNDFGMSINAFYSEKLRSDNVYHDIYNNSYDMSEASSINSLNLNFGANYKNFSIKMLYMNDTYKMRDAYEIILPAAVKESFETFCAELKYSYQINQKLSITPKFSFKRNTPWNVYHSDLLSEEELAEIIYNTKADRYKLNISSLWDASKNLYVNFGVESFIDVAEKLSEGMVFHNTNRKTASYFNAAVFAQTFYQNKIANLILGARYDLNNEVGSAFVPRVGLTKRIEKFNFKLLYSQSFKSPTIENIALSYEENIKPERTSVWELETGYQLNKDVFLSLNIFDITTKNTIIFYVDSTLVNEQVPDGYFNVDKSGSQGFELDFKALKPWGSFAVGYSFYDNRNKSRVSIYDNPLATGEALGFAKHKITFTSTINFSSHIFASPSIIFKSEKTAITSIDANEEYIYERLPATYELNLFLGYKNLFVKNLNLSLGVYNILDQSIYFVQPYSSGHAPLPSGSREAVIKLGYRL